MDVQELRNLQEAYNQVHQVDEAEKWIQKAIKKPGALSKQLGVPEEENIPVEKLKSAAKKGGKLGKRARLAMTLKGLRREEIDIYDIILTHLLDEGYAETSEAAEVIMVNMSEEWREEILEGEEKKEESQKPFTGEGPKKPKGWRPTGPKLKSGQRPGYAR